MRSHAALGRTTAVIILVIIGVAAASGFYYYSTSTKKHIPVCGKAHVLASVTVASNASSPNLGGIAYDSGKGALYVSETSFNTVAVVSMDTNKVVKNISLGPRQQTGFPMSLVYDPVKGYIYVITRPNVLVISDASNTVIANISVPAGPNGAAYDPSTGYVYLTAGYPLLGIGTNMPGRVYAISDQTNLVVRNFTAGFYPTYIAADGKGSLFVLDYVKNSTGSYLGAVTVLSASSGSTKSNFVLPAYPSGNFATVAYDSWREYIYLTTISLPGPVHHAGITDTLYQVSLSDGGVAKVAAAPIPAYASLAYDSLTDCVYATGGGQETGVGDLVAIAAKNNTIVQTILLPRSQGTPAPVLFAFNEAAGYLYLSDQSGKVWIISDGSRAQQ